MSIKPILFSTPTVQAILDGRKTTTRRVITDGDLINAFDIDVDGSAIGWRDVFGDFHKPEEAASRQVGDVLWVRETWQSLRVKKPVKAIPSDFRETVYLYRADGYIRNSDGSEFKWRPSIHMPKTAARIFLRVTDVCVERLKDITEVGAEREGCTFYGFEMLVSADEMETAREEFARLWDDLNAKRGYGWDTNPWVWVYTFERVDKPKGWV